MYLWYCISGYSCIAVGGRVPYDGRVHSVMPLCVWRGVGSCVCADIEVPRDTLGGQSRGTGTECASDMGLPRRHASRGELINRTCG